MKILDFHIVLLELSTQCGRTDERTSVENVLLCKLILKNNAKFFTVWPTTSWKANIEGKTLYVDCFFCVYIFKWRRSKTITKIFTSIVTRSHEVFGLKVLCMLRHMWFNLIRRSGLSVWCYTLKHWTRYYAPDRQLPMIIWPPVIGAAALGWTSKLFLFQHFGLSNNQSLSDDRGAPDSSFYYLGSSSRLNATQLWDCLSSRILA